MKKLILFWIAVSFMSYSNAQQYDDLSFGTDSTLDVMSWNIEWFPKDGSTTLNYVIEILTQLDMDVIAIQEVDELAYFSDLMDALPGYNSYTESSYFAGLALIYKTDVISINEIKEIYTTSEYWNTFPRHPQVIDFNFQNQRFILINNHLKCCGDGVLNTSSTSDEENRRYMAMNLLKQYIDTELTGEQVIITGDLNDILTDSPSNNVFQHLLDDTLNYYFADMDIALGSSSDWSYPSWPSHLDHMAITQALFDDFENSGSSIEAIKLETYLPGGWSDYDSHISDHRPVAMKLNLVENNSIYHPSEKEGFVLFPNPAKQEINIESVNLLSNKSLEIYNSQGIRIMQLSLDSSSKAINISHLSPGLYFIKMDNSTQKFVIQ